MTGTVQEEILARAGEDGARPALAFVDGTGGHAWLSREALLERAGRAASVLGALGAAPGAVGLVVSADPRECALAVLALLHAGARPLCVAPPAMQGRHSSLGEVLLDVVARAPATLAVLPRGLVRDAEALREARPGLRVELGFERLLGARGPTAAPARVAADDVAALQLTSGTTGFPRIAAWEQRRVLAALRGMARGMGTGDDEVYLNWTPLYHDMGLVNNLLFCLVHGIPLALMSPLDVVRRPSLWLRALSTTGATTTWSPNFGYALAAARVRDPELEGVWLGGVRGFWNAAERVHLETLRRFRARLAGHGVAEGALRTNFGCVETIGGVTFSGPGGVRLERLDVAELEAEGTARVLPEGLERASAQWFVGCGRAYPGSEVLALDEEGRPLPDGRVGDVALHTEGRFDGYLGRPEESAAVRRGDLVRTGDLGYVRDGELFWTGRRSERVNLQGRKLDPSELEGALFAVEGLRKGCFVAYGREDPERGTEVLVVLAEVEPEAAARCAANAARVRAEVAAGPGVAIEELALVARGELTKTSSGKRRHRFFRELHERGRLRVLHRSRAGRLGGAGGAPEG